MHAASQPDTTIRVMANAASGELPEGLALSEDGHLTGSTWARPAIYAFAVAAQDVTTHGREVVPLGLEVLPEMEATREQSGAGSARAGGCQHTGAAPSLPALAAVVLLLGTARRRGRSWICRRGVKPPP
jgi:uncharacterized protein (TIGR03382 family)